MLNDPAETETHPTRMPMHSALPEVGAVLGIDVGFSPTKRSSAVCRLEWHSQAVRWTMQRFRAVVAEREAAINNVAGRHWLLAAAIDGPLREGLDVIGRYRTAERMLTRRLGKRIGKPGQSSAPVGRKLNAAANDCARTVLSHTRLAPSNHTVRIHDRAIVEAFPSAFLGVMLDDPAAVVAHRDDRSDTFYQHLTADRTLENLLNYLLPDRRIEQSLTSVTGHDERAGLVCALCALSVASGDFVAVGDDDGWIILPPRPFVREWAWEHLTANANSGHRDALHCSSA